MISSSKHVLKSTDTGAVREFVLPVQMNEHQPEGKKRERASARFSRNFIPGRIVPEETAATEEPETGTELEVEAEEESEVVKEARRQAEEILREAEAVRKEAQEQALLEKQRAVEQGYREGFEWGQQEGHKQAYEEHEARLAEEWKQFEQDMERALHSVDEAKKQTLDAYLDDLKDCAIAVGEKIIHISLQSSGAIIKRMIIAETEKIKKTAWAKIYMARNDYEMLMQADEDVINELSRFSEHIKFVVMNRERSGDCIIETPEEVIDISVDTQMENIRRVLENIR